MKQIIFAFILLFLVSCQPQENSDRRLAPGDGPTPIPTTAAVTRPVYTVARGDVTSQLHFTGRVAPVDDAMLTFPLDGRITEVTSARGTIVKAGDILFKLDPATDIELAYRRAEIQVKLAQLDLDHVLVKASTPPTLDQQYQIDRLVLFLELAQMDLEKFQIGIGDDLDAAMQIIAPFDGVIVSLNAAIGQEIVADEIIGVLADVSQLEITADLRDSQLQDLSEGLAVMIEPAGHPGEALYGRLEQLPYPYGSGGGSEIDQNEPSIRIVFDNPELAMTHFELGDLVSLTINIFERRDVLWLPMAAIREFNGRTFVVVQDDEIEQRVDVTLGLIGEGRVEILEGINEGQVIIGQ